MTVAAGSLRNAEDAVAAPAPRRKRRPVRLMPPPVAAAGQPALLDWALAVAAAADQRVAELEARLAYLEGQVVTDEVSGVLNRRGFVLEFSRAIAMARRGGPGGAVMICDLDGFKRVNDLLGHATGDEVLRQVSALLRSKVRKMDSVARLGGDEFAVLLIGATLVSARRKCQCIARALTAIMQQLSGQAIAMSASFGIAAFTGEEEEETVLHRADMAMYEEKRRKAGAARTVERL